jgi:lipase
VIGHSMGGSVAVVLADRHPDRVDRLVLVDGGPPIIRERPAGTVEEIVRDAIGPALDRLDMTFPSVPAYLDFWRGHPAWAEWTTYAEDAFTYDLVGQPPSLRSGVSKDAVIEDGGSLLVSEDVPNATANLRHQATLLYAPRGMLDQVPGMFPPDVVDGWVAQLPTLTAVAVPDVNHYTILMSDRGAAVIASIIETGRPPRD